MKPNSVITRTTKKNDPYDVCKVIGPSPVSTPSDAEWAAGGGNAVIVQPVEQFGANQVMPIEYIAENYTVEEPTPDNELHDEMPRVNVHGHEPSPEEVFAKQARAAKAKPAPKTKT